MHPNKLLVRQLFNAYQNQDLETIKTIVNASINYEVVGYFSVKGHYEYIQHLYTDHFIEMPSTKIFRETAEGDFVSTEGDIRAIFKNGNPFYARFHNAYHFRHGQLIAQRTYVIPVKELL